MNVQKDYAGDAKARGVAVSLHPAGDGETKEVMVRLDAIQNASIDDGYVRISVKRPS